MLDPLTLQIYSFTLHSLSFVSYPAPYSVFTPLFLNSLATKTNVSITVGFDHIHFRTFTFLICDIRNGFDLFLPHLSPSVHVYKISFSSLGYLTLKFLSNNIMVFAEQADLRSPRKLSYSQIRRTYTGLLLTVTHFMGGGLQLLIIKYNKKTKKCELAK